MKNLYFVVMGDGSWGALRANSRGQVYAYLLRNDVDTESVLIWQCLDDTTMPFVELVELK